MACLAVTIGVVPSAFGQPEDESPRERTGRLFNKLDKNMRGGTTEEVSIAAEELWKAKRDLPRKSLIEAAQDPTLLPESRGYAVDLLAGEEFGPVSDDLRAILKDPGTVSDVREKILVDFDFTAADAPMLEELSEKDGGVGFHAMQALASANPTSAIKKARTALAGKSASDDRRSAALKVLVRSNKYATSKRLQSDVIDSSTEILTDANASEALKQSATYALAESNTIASLRVVLTHQQDSTMRAGVVVQNGQMISRVLDDCSNLADVAVAADALSVQPIIDLSPALTECAARLDDKRLIRIASDVADATPALGVPLNRKWEGK